MVDLNARIVYRPYPHPDALPPSLGPTQKLIYQEFWDHRGELRRIGQHPTKEGYERWHDLLAGLLPT